MTDTPTSRVAALKTDRTTARLYSFAVTFLVFSLLWLGIATHPFPSATAKTTVAQISPKESQIQQREQAVALRSRQVNKVLQQRWAHYRVARKARLRQINLANAAYRRQLIASQAAAKAAAVPAANYSYAPSRSYAPSYSAPAVHVVQSAPASHTRTS